MQAFEYTSQPVRVVFRASAWSVLKAETVALGARRAFVLCTPRQRALALSALDALADLGAGYFDQAAMHVPLPAVQAAVQAAQAVSADCIVAVGGGSTIGLAKALAVQTPMPIVAVPTTYSGSEMTAIYGVTEEGVKRTGKHANALPRTVIYDPALSLHLPLAVSVTSGLNAIAHAAEGLYARDGNPLLSTIAEEGIRAMAAGMQALLRNGEDIEARSECLYGSWLCGTVLGSAGMSLHHKLCHTLGGSFDLPHAETHAVVLPHAMAYNSAAAPEAMRRITRALGRPGQAAATALYELARSLGAPTSLREIGMKEADLDLAARLAVAQPYWNPRAVDQAGVRALLQSAFDGRQPQDLH